MLIGLKNGRALPLDQDRPSICAKIATAVDSFLDILLKIKNLEAPLGAGIRDFPKKLFRWIQREVYNEVFLTPNATIHDDCTG